VFEVFQAITNLAYSSMRRSGAYFEVVKKAGDKG
jgi:hypothetical protein